VSDAAAALGVTVDAIRKRIQRRTIAHERDEDGRVWVILDTDQDTASKVHDTDQDTAARDELVDELRDQVRFLREELARKDAILLRMAENIPQLEAPSQEPRESPQSAARPGPGETPTEERGGPQTPSERPWWRRMFGG
jgi:hypothetical protein